MTYLLSFERTIPFRCALNTSRKSCLWSVNPSGKMDGELVSFHLITLWDQSYWSIFSSLSVNCLFEITLLHLSLGWIRQGLQSYLLEQCGFWPRERFQSRWKATFPAKFQTEISYDHLSHSLVWWKPDAFSSRTNAYWYLRFGIETGNKIWNE